MTGTSHDDFFDLRLTNRKLLLRFKRHIGRSTDYGSIKANKDLDDKQWHKVKIQRNKKEMILTIDDYKIRKKAPGNDLHFGSLERNNFVFLGGMPATYKNKENRHKLTLPTIMFGLGWRGQIRKLQYSNCSCPLRSAKIMKLSGARRDNLCETNYHYYSSCYKNNPNCDCLIDASGKKQCDCKDKSCRPVNNCCKTRKCLDYRGMIAVTEEGDTCQDWGKDTVNRNSGNDPADHPEAGLIKNYCRNPSKAEKPWCYTLNPSKKWGYCAIPVCSGSGLLNEGKECWSQCNKRSGRCNWCGSGSCCRIGWFEDGCGAGYTGCQNNHCCTKTITEPSSGFGIVDAKNSFGTRTFQDASTTRDHMKVTEVNNCCKTRKCLDYRGMIAVTEEGDTCQDWGKDTVNRNSGND